MGDLLDRDDIMDSFIAVQSFVRAGGHYAEYAITFDCNILLDKRKQFMDTFEFELKGNTNPAYVLYSNFLKSMGYHQPLWSSYNLIVWNETEQSLEFELANKHYTIKHKS